MPRLPGSAVFRALCSAILLAGLLYGCVISAPSGRSGAAAGVPPRIVSDPVSPAQFLSTEQIALEVRAGLAQRALADNVQPSLQLLAERREYGNDQATGCIGAQTYEESVSVAACTFGDAGSSRILVLEGDSRAQMWFDTMDTIAKATGYRMVFLSKPGCPSAIGNFRLNDGKFENAPWPACTAWHTFVLATMRALSPRVIVTTSQLLLYPSGTTVPASVPVMQSDYEAFYRQLPPSSRIVVLGGFPEPMTLNPTLCLSRQPANIQSCTWTVPPEVSAGNAAVRAAAATIHARFIDEDPWLCAGSRCPPVVNDLIPYTIDGFHLDRVYAAYLTGALWTALAPALSR